MVRGLLLGSAFAVALAGAAGAAPTEPDEIVVTGERLSRQEARDRARAFIEHTGIVNNRSSVARWIDPVCPRAVGLDAPNGQRVERKVREIAEAAEVPLGKADCTPNVTINFVDDGAAFARNILARDDRYLAEVPAPLKRSVVEGAAPIRWWYRTGLRPADPSAMTAMVPPGLKASDSDFGAPDLPNNGAAGTMLGYKSSAMQKVPARALRSATVVVDTVRSRGVPLDAVAAYAAMVALAELEPRDAPFSGSILGLFGDQPSRSLTRFDETFLRELYSLPLDRRAPQQRGRLVRALQNEASKF